MQYMAVPSLIPDTSTLWYCPMFLCALSSCTVLLDVHIVPLRDVTVGLRFPASRRMYLICGIGKQTSLPMRYIEGHDGSTIPMG